MFRRIVSLGMVCLLYSVPALADRTPKPVDPVLRPMTFTIVRSSEKGCEPACGEWLMAEGQITQASPLAFRKALDAMAPRKLPVVLLSAGGNMVAAVEIGYMLRRAGLSAAVGRTLYKGCRPDERDCKRTAPLNGVYRGRVISIDSFCMSACPLILAAGVKRLASPRTTVGVHQIRSYRLKKKTGDPDAPLDPDNLVFKDGTPQFSAFIDNVLGSYLATMGVSRELLSDMQKASGENIYTLSSKRRAALKLVTGKGGVESLVAKGTE